MQQHPSRRHPTQLAPPDNRHRNAAPRAPIKHALHNAGSVSGLLLGAHFAVLSDDLGCVRTKSAGRRYLLTGPAWSLTQRGAGPTWIEIPGLPAVNGPASRQRASAEQAGVIEGGDELRGRDGRVDRRGPGIGVPHQLGDDAAGDASQRQGDAVVVAEGMGRCPGR